ncbi:MAG: AMIN domain-containing protein [Chloroflexota bacterium]
MGAETMNLMNKTRKLAPNGTGPAARTALRRRAWVMLPLLYLVAPALSAAVLQDMAFETGPGGRVELTLTLDEPAPQPEVFTTSDPERIVLDLAGTSSGLSDRTLAIGSGAAERATAVAAGSPTSRKWAMMR